MQADGPKHLTASQPSARIAVIASSFPVTSETFVVDHVRALADDGFDVTVVAIEIDEAARRKLSLPTNVSLCGVPRWDNLHPVRRIKYLGSALLWMARHPTLAARRYHWRRAISAARLKDVLGRLEPDLVHAHFGPNGVDAAIALCGTATPLLVNFHGYDVTTLPTRHGWRLYRSTLRSATLVAHSDFVERRLRGAGLHRIERVTMGVDRSKFRAPLRSPTWAAPLKLLSVGRLVPQKGHDVAIHALAILRRERPDLDPRLRILGEGPEAVSLRRISHDAGVAEFVIGPEPADHARVAEAMAEADLVIAASRTMQDGAQEGFCRVAVEAMACGLPVVATPSGGLPDTVAGGGRVASTQDASSLAHAILEILEQGAPASWSTAAQTVAARYDIQTMHDEYRNLTDRHLSPSVVSCARTHN